MWQQVPFTDIKINEFGTVCYEDFKGKTRCDNGYNNKSGYRLIKIGRNKFYYIHRLVARVFVKNPCPTYFTVVHHKDQNRENNCASNLEWTTVQMNNAQRKRMKLTKKTRRGFRVQFIFDGVLYNRYKIWDTKEKAIQSANNIKAELINAKRMFFIDCEENGTCPNKQQCVTCGHTCYHSKVQ